WSSNSAPLRDWYTPRTFRKLSSPEPHATRKPAGVFFRRRSHHLNTRHSAVWNRCSLSYEKTAKRDRHEICEPRSLLQTHAVFQQLQPVMGVLDLGYTCQRRPRQNDMTDGTLPGVLPEKPWGFVPIELQSRSRCIQSLLTLRAVHTHPVGWSTLTY